MITVAHRGFSFSKINLKHKLQTAQNKRICLYFDLPHRCHIGVAHFRKINRLPVSDRVESCIATAVFKHWNEIVLSHINDMFQPSHNTYNTRSQITLYIPLQKTNTGKQALSFLGQKILTKINHSTKTVKPTASFRQTLKRGILSKLFR